MWRCASLGCRCDLKSKIKEMNSRVMTDDDMVEEESGNDIFFGSEDSNIVTIEAKMPKIK